MIELLSESFRIPNLPATILLLIVLLYWIINIIGIFDLDMLHGEAELDHGHVDADHPHTESFAGKTFDFGDVPIAIVVSFFVLFLWMTTILANYYLGNTSLIFALLLYVPSIIASFILTRVIAIPLSRMYKLLRLHTEETVEVKDYSGSVCTVVVEASPDKMGQGEINRRGDPIRVNIKTYPGKVISKGSTALLIEYQEGKDIYLAEPYDSGK